MSLALLPRTAPIGAPASSPLTGAPLSLPSGVPANNAVPFRPGGGGASGAPQGAPFRGAAPIQSGPRPFSPNWNLGPLKGAPLPTAATSAAGAGAGATAAVGVGGAAVGLAVGEALRRDLVGDGYDGFAYPSDTGRQLSRPLETLGYGARGSAQALRDLFGPEELAGQPPPVPLAPSDGTAPFSGGQSPGVFYTVTYSNKGSYGAYQSDIDSTAGFFGPVPALVRRSNPNGSWTYGHFFQGVFSSVTTWANYYIEGVTAIKSVRRNDGLPDTGGNPAPSPEQKPGNPPPRLLPLSVPAFSPLPAAEPGVSPFPAPAPVPIAPPITDPASDPAPAPAPAPAPQPDAPAIPGQLPQLDPAPVPGKTSPATQPAAPGIPAIPGVPIVPAVPRVPAGPRPFGQPFVSPAPGTPPLPGLSPPVPSQFPIPGQAPKTTPGGSPKSLPPGLPTTVNPTPEGQLNPGTATTPGISMGSGGGTGSGPQIDICAAPCLVDLGQKANQAELDLEEILRLLRAIYKTVGVDDFPGSMPLLNGRGSKPVKNLPELTRWVIQAFDSVYGQFPLDVQVYGPDGKTKNLKLENLAHSVDELFGLMLTIAEDADAAVNIAARNVVEAIQGKIAAKQAGEIAAANAKFLGYNLKSTKKEVKISVTPAASGPDNKLQNQEMKNFLKPSTQNYIGSEYDDDKQVLPILERTLEDGEIARAALYRPVKTGTKDGDIGLTGEHIKNSRTADDIMEKAWANFLKELEKEGYSVDGNKSQSN